MSRPLNNDFTISVNFSIDRHHSTPILKLEVWAIHAAAEQDIVSVDSEDLSFR